MNSTILYRSSMSGAAVIEPGRLYHENFGLPGSRGNPDQAGEVHVTQRCALPIASRLITVSNCLLPLYQPLQPKESNILGAIVAPLGTFPRFSPPHLRVLFGRWVVALQYSPPWKPWMFVKPGPKQRPGPALPLIARVGIRQTKKKSVAVLSSSGS